MLKSLPILLSCARFCGDEPCPTIFFEPSHFPNVFALAAPGAASAAMAAMQMTHARGCGGQTTESLRNYLHDGRFVVFPRDVVPRVPHARSVGARGGYGRVSEAVTILILRDVLHDFSRGEAPRRRVERPRRVRRSAVTRSAVLLVGRAEGDGRDGSVGGPRRVMRQQRRPGPQGMRAGEQRASLRGQVEGDRLERPPGDAEGAARRG